MKKLSAIFIIAIIYIAGCSPSEPDGENKRVLTFTVNDHHVTIHNLFNDGSSFTVEIPGSTYFEVTAEKGGESHSIVFSNIEWGPVNEYSNEIAAFEVTVDGNYYSYSKLHIDPVEAHISPHIGTIQFKATGSIGDISWSINSNGSGGNINNDGLYSVGTNYMSVDVVEVIDSENGSDMGIIYISGNYEIISSCNASYASTPKQLVWDGQQLWARHLNTLLNVDPVNGVSFTNTIEFELPSNNYIIGIEFAGTVYWVLCKADENYMLYKFTESGQQLNGYDVSALENYFLGENDECHGLTWDGNNLWTCSSSNMGNDNLIKIDTTGLVIEDLTFHLSNHFYEPRSHHGIGILDLTWDGNRLCGIGEYQRLGLIHNGIEDIYYDLTGTGIAWDGEFFWISSSASIYKIKPLD